MPPFLKNPMLCNAGRTFSFFQQKTLDMKWSFQTERHDELCQCFPEKKRTTWSSRWTAGVLSCSNDTLKTKQSLIDTSLPPWKVYICAAYLNQSIEDIKMFWRCSEGAVMASVFILTSKDCRSQDNWVVILNSASADEYCLKMGHFPPFLNRRVCIFSV